MNKIFIAGSSVVFLLCFFTISTFAQIQVGAKLGLNGTTLSRGDFDINNASLDSLGLDFPDLTDTEFKFGLNAGVFAILDLGPVNVMPEVLWSMKGAKNFARDLDIATHYISIPVLVGIDIADIFTLQVGPQAGFLMDALAKPADRDSYSIKDSYGYKGVDFAGVIGVMFQWPNVGHISARYMHGLTPAQIIFNTSGREFKFFNRTLQMSIGIPIVKVGN